jgi:hypothetical protein
MKPAVSANSHPSIPPILRLDPLRHVLRALVLMVPQHRAGEVGGAVFGEAFAQRIDAFDQRGAMLLVAEPRA